MILSIYTISGFFNPSENSENVKFTSEHTKMLEFYSQVISPNVLPDGTIPDKVFFELADKLQVFNANKTPNENNPYDKLMIMLSKAIGYDVLQTVTNLKSRNSFTLENFIHDTELLVTTRFALEMLTEDILKIWKGISIIITKKNEELKSKKQAINHTVEHLKTAIAAMVFITKPGACGHLDIVKESCKFDEEMTGQSKALYQKYENQMAELNKVSAAIALEMNNIKDVHEQSDGLRVYINIHCSKDYKILRETINTWMSTFFDLLRKTKLDTIEETIACVELSLKRFNTTNQAVEESITQIKTSEELYEELKSKMKSHSNSFPFFTVDTKKPVIDPAVSLTEEYIQNPHAGTVFEMQDMGKKNRM